MTQQPDPYQQFLEEARAEWAEDDDRLYRQFYPETDSTKETR
jgi:hypothetical protein